MTTVINADAELTANRPGIDVLVPDSDGWWMKRLADKLKVQQKEAEALQQRFEGNAPLPFVSDIQKDAVKWFVAKSRTNFEAVIVRAVLSRLRIRGIRTAVDDDQGGDGDAFKTYRNTHGKLWSRDAIRMALAMKRSAVIVGKSDDGQLLVTAEDPRLVVWISDPANPYKVLAALKLYHDDVRNEDVGYLYRPGRVRVARRSRTRRPGTSDVTFNPAAYSWDEDIVDDMGAVVYAGASGTIDWLADKDADGNVIVDENGQAVGGRIPLIPFVNEDEKAEFEPFIPQIDRINQQILQRMTIATIQAFKQRALKGAPRKDPNTNEPIDYDAILTADPGSIWLLPEGVELWESGEVDLTPILSAIRDDVKDLYATSGTPAYLASPDAANSSAESASLQREMTVFKVEERQERFEPSFDLVLELMFATLGDDARAEPGTLSVIWAPAERLSMTEKASAVAQTKGVMPRRAQLTDIMGYDPDEAERLLSDLADDMVLDQRLAASMAAAQNATAAPTKPPATPRGGARVPVPAAG